MITRYLYLILLLLLPVGVFGQKYEKVLITSSGSTGLNSVSNGCLRIDTPTGGIIFPDGSKQTSAAVPASVTTSLSTRVYAIEIRTNNWNSAYSWGNHAAAGYLFASNASAVWWANAETGTVRNAWNWLGQNTNLWNAAITNAEGPGIEVSGHTIILRTNNWTFSSTSASNTVSTYPTFSIPLGGTWTDFELKASTNDFTSVLFYFKSTGFHNIALVYDDPDPKVFFTDSTSDDVRKWRVSSNHVSIISQLNTPGVAIVRAALYQASLLGIMQDSAATNNLSDWMNIFNQKLVWSYTRFDGVGFERDIGNNVIWTPITPVWVPNRTSP
jgi:hypothetical protein